MDRSRRRPARARSGDPGVQHRYRLGEPLGSGTRPRIDDGELGIVVLHAHSARREGGGPSLLPWREWSAPSFEVSADGPVPAGVDGEATVLEPPLRFGVHAGALRVRIAPAHPGASPSGHVPADVRVGVAELARIAVGRPSTS